MTESQVQTKLLGQLTKTGWFYNTNDRFRAGIPDILGSWEGHFYGIEVKIDYTKVTPLQEYELLNITASGGTGLVVRYLNKTKEYVMGELQTKSLSGVIARIKELAGARRN